MYFKAVTTEMYESHALVKMRLLQCALSWENGLLQQQRYVNESNRNRDNLAPQSCTYTASQISNYNCTVKGEMGGGGVALKSLQNKSTAISSRADKWLHFSLFSTTVLLAHRSSVWGKKRAQQNKKRKRQRGALLHFSLRHCVKPVWQTGSNWRDDTGVGRKGPPQHGPGLGLPESPYNWLYSRAFDCRSVCLKANDVDVWCLPFVTFAFLPAWLSLALFFYFH